MHQGDTFLESREADGLYFYLLGLLQPLQPALQVGCVSIRIAVGKGSFVLLERKGVLEGEGAVELATVFDVDFVFIVEDVEARSSPSLTKLLRVH